MVQFLTLPLIRDQFSSECYYGVQMTALHPAALITRGAAFTYTALSRILQKDADQEMEMRTEIQNMRLELSSISMMDEFARYARLERKINKMTDKLKTHVKSRTAQQAKMKWIVNIIFYILQAVLMISLIWKYYADPVTVVPSKWISPLERLVAFPSGVAGGVGITCWLVVCNKVVAIGMHAF